MTFAERQPLLLFEWKTVIWKVVCCVLREDNSLMRSRLKATGKDGHTESSVASSLFFPNAGQQHHALRLTHPCVRF